MIIQVNHRGGGKASGERAEKGFDAVTRGR
jgi:hypothetical protein